MKTKIAALCLAAAALLSPACEQHKWDETQKLFKDGEHSEKAEHGKASAHEEKKGEEAKH
jgi:hypothetical protein